MWIDYRDAKLKVNWNKIGKPQKSIVFKKKTNNFEIYSQHKHSNKRVDSSSCKFLEN